MIKMRTKGRSLKPAYFLIWPIVVWNKREIQIVGCRKLQKFVVHIHPNSNITNVSGEGVSGLTIRLADKQYGGVQWTSPCQYTFTELGVFLTQLLYLVKANSFGLKYLFSNDTCTVPVALRRKGLQKSQLTHMPNINNT